MRCSNCGSTSSSPSQWAPTSAIWLSSSRAGVRRARRSPDRPWRRVPGYLQARQQRGRHWIGTLLLLHLLHQHAQQVEAVAVVAAQLGLRAMLAAQLRHHGRLQVGYAGGGAGLRLQACENRIHGRARHCIAIRRCCAGMACLLQQRMQRAARGGGQARRGRVGCAVIPKASCTRLDQEPAGADPFQPVSGAAARFAGCVARPPPTDWVMIRRVLDERAR